MPVLKKKNKNLAIHESSITGGILMCVLLNASAAEVQVQLYKLELVILTAAILMC